MDGSYFTRTYKFCTQSLISGTTILWLVLILANIVFWSPIFNGFFYADEIHVISKINHEGAFNLIFEPWNEHFMPLYLMIFYLEYYFFGLNAVYYLIISFCLFITSLFIIRKFLLFWNIPERWILMLLTLYSLNPSYGVLPLLFTMDRILAFIFLVLALRYTHKYYLDSKVANAVLASGFSLLSSFSSGVGTVSFLFVFIYYWFVLHRFSFSFLSSKISRKFFSILCVFGLFYAILFFAFAYKSINERITVNNEHHSNLISFDILSALPRMAYSFVDGLVLPSFGVTSKLGLQTFLSLNIITLCLILLAFSFLWFLLKKWELYPEKARFILFYCFALFLNYFSVFMLRNKYGAEVYASPGWERYHYFPAFFLIGLLAIMISITKLRYMKLKNGIVFLFILIVLILQFPTSKPAAEVYLHKEFKEFAFDWQKALQSSDYPMIDLKINRPIHYLIQTDKTLYSLHKDFDMSLPPKAYIMISDIDKRFWEKTPESYKQFYAKWFNYSYEESSHLFR